AQSKHSLRLQRHQAPGTGRTRALDRGNLQQAFVEVKAVHGEPQQLIRSKSLGENANDRVITRPLEVTHSGATAPGRLQYVLDEVFAERLRCRILRYRIPLQPLVVPRVRVVVLLGKPGEEVPKVALL